MPAWPLPGGNRVMTEILDPPPPKLKVKRSRKRMYEPLPQHPLAAEPTGDKLAPARPSEARRAHARKLVNRYAALASSVGLLPMPLVDMLAAGSLQLKLIRELSIVYEAPFSGQRAKAVIAALIGGGQTALLIKSMLKFVPVVGYPLIAVPAAATAGGLTYAIGKVFIFHFELGGTLLDFDPAKLRAHFKQQLSQQADARVLTKAEARE